ncbi:EAL domain-containing protein [Aromatoleum evansii]|uniref:EAL domain-containing protein n=1 Tax=Aromatoleum evansii TaxID=59406 RepID=A0ABZ1AQH1_AROEV|nr:EAL domain-containing protein [Aromatoleum evansii]
MTATVPPAGRGGALPEAAFASIGERPVVLAVDDEPQILAALADTLEDECIVHTAPSAEAAIALIPELPELSVLLSDQRMPGMCGDEMLARARGLSRAAAIMVTGYADLDAVVRAVNQGRIFGYITKPWNQEQLRLMVHSAHSHYRLQRELLAEQRLLREFMNNTTDLVFYQDGGQRFIRANRQSALLLGCESPDALVGRTAVELLPDVEPGGVWDSAEHDRVLRSGEPTPEQCVRVRLPGGDQWRWFSTTRAPIRDEGDAVVGVVGLARDVTDRVGVLEALRLRERAIEASVNAVVVVDCQQPDLPIVYVNPAFERITGYRAEEAIGRNARFLHGTDHDQPGLDEVRALVRDRREGQAIFRNHCKDGRIYWADLHIAPVCDDAGRCTHFVGVQYDVTERIRYQEELERHANFDGVTGVANRNLLDDRLAQALVHANRHQCSVGVLSIGIDRFGGIVGSFGHAVGDDLLRGVAARLTALVREGDTVARVGMDDFVVVLGDLAGVDAAGLIVRRILDELARPFVIEGHELAVTASIGVCLYPGDGNSPAELLQHANIARLEAHGAGGNQYCFDTPALNATVLRRQALEHALRGALERGEFVLHYQPRVSLKDGAIVGLEALLRWQHPELGLVPPLQFIPLAEETGLIVPVGEWVIGAACRQIRCWRERGLAVPPVAINLSARQFRSGELHGTIAAALAAEGLEGAQLELEITESTTMADVEEAVATMRKLKALGVSLALDDFGTGYSSLAYLKRFPIDYLKIDRAFVRDVVTEPDDAAICIATIRLAHSLRLKVIAEGVESEAQMEYLRRQGCDEIQGFYFSRPVEGEALAVMLGDGARMALAAFADGAPPPTLLLIDDEPYVLSALKRLLRHDGYRILSVASAHEGLEILARQPVHVLLADERMPGMNGSDFLMRVKELHPGTVRMMLSGYANVDAITRAINNGAVSKFLLKPWDDEELRATIREAVALVCAGSVPA